MAKRHAEVLTLKDSNKRDNDSASASSVNDKVKLTMSIDSISRDAETLNKENLSFWHKCFGEVVLPTCLPRAGQTSLIKISHISEMQISHLERI